MGALPQDLRFAVRLLLKDRGFTVTVLLTLALCLGANIAIFSAVYAVLLRPLPVPEADRLILIYNVYPEATGGTASARGANSVPHYDDRVRELGDVFEAQALYQGAGFAVGGEMGAEQLVGWRVTPSFFRLMRVAPHLGRVFDDDEGEAGNERKVVVSYGLWQRRFAGAPSVVGQTLRINGLPYEVVGVMPASFVIDDPDVALWTPAVFPDQERSDQARHNNNWQMLGRLRPGATLAQAQARIDQMTAAELERSPAFRQILIDAGFRTLAFPYQEAIVRDIRATLYLLWGGVLFVLLIGCVNIANLMLIRSNVRLRELAMRHALGAGRDRLARQLLTEAVVLTVAGAALGLGVGAVALRFLGALGVHELPRGHEIALDPIVAGVTLAAAVGLGLVLGLAPVTMLGGSTLERALRQESRGETTGRGARLFRHTLVVAQVAVASVLLVGGVLMLVSFQRVLAVDPGFQVDRLLTGQVALPDVRYPDDDARLTFARRALTALRALPGVVEAGLTSAIPFGGNQGNNVIRAVGYEERPGESLVSPSNVVIDDRYLQTMGIPLVAGRYFDSGDTPESRPTIIIDDRLAARFWPEGDALGGELYTDVALTDDTTRYTVVGVVAEHRRQGLVDGPQQVGAFFVPHTQRPIRSPTFAIRITGPPDTLVNPFRAAIAAIDPELPVFVLQTMAQRIGERLVSRRTPMLLALGFAAIALFLSTVGVYGVLAYRVTQRTREFGIRLALGCSVPALFRLVLSEGMVIVAAGLLAGLAGTAILADVIGSQLYGVEATDPLVTAGMLALLGVVGVAASALPARRATRVDPVTALAD